MRYERNASAGRSLKFGVKNAAQPADYLKGKIDIELLNDKSSDCIWINVRKETLLQSNFQIDQDQLTWLRVIQNEKSDGYYKSWDHLLAENEDILVLPDQRSNYVSSNSHKLGLELLLARGIQETDYINKTTSWKCYEGWLVMYCENYLGFRLEDEMQQDMQDKYD